MSDAPRRGQLRKCRLVEASETFRERGAMTGRPGQRMRLRDNGCYKARHISGRSADRPRISASSIAANSRALSRESVPARGR